ncbi:MAG TPA: efflux RND transporter periplasmic adaptor subunit [Blastocatellia bacterium]|nr:efflux RND transporter periplasmic adaptor subunit [Blastocatellia bacterium]
MRNQTSIQEKDNLRTSKPLLLAALVVAVSVAAACANSQAKDSAGAASNSQPAAAPTPIDLTTAPAITRNLQRNVEVVGSFAADEEVVVSAQAAGELSQLNVDFGSFVSQGQVIATIDQRDAKLKVEQAEATLKQTLARLGMKEGEHFDPNRNADVRVAKSQLDWAKLELDRSMKLIENGDIPRSSYDEKVTNHNLAQARYQAALDSVGQQLAAVEQQKASLALARKALTDTVVRSPISGAVKEKHASRGAYLTVNGRIVTLVKINPLRLRADIPESSAAAVRTGQTINVAVDAFPGRAFTGRVVRIGPSMDEKTRALTVEAEVANSGNLLRPGMFAKSRLITSANAPAVMVPQRAVAPAAGLSKVFVIDNGKAVERIVKTGAVDGDLIEIVEGVKEGEIVATSNLEKLLTGVTVNNK